MENYLNIKTGALELGYPIKKQVLKSVLPTKTGAPSFLSKDDGVTQAGRNFDFYTLDTDNINPFGNYNRFTNDKGGSFNDNTDGSTADYVIDNSTTLGYKLTYGMVRYLVDHLNFAETLNIGVYTGFRVANLNELVPVQQPDALLPDSSIFGSPVSNELLINKYRDSLNCYRVYKNTGILNVDLTTIQRHTLFVRDHKY